MVYLKFMWLNIPTIYFVEFDVLYPGRIQRWRYHNVKLDQYPTPVAFIEAFKGDIGFISKLRIGLINDG